MDFHFGKAAQLGVRNRRLVAIDGSDGSKRVGRDEAERSQLAKGFFKLRGQKARHHLEILEKQCAARAKGFEYLLRLATRKWTDVGTDFRNQPRQVFTQSERNGHAPSERGHARAVVLFSFWWSQPAPDE